MPADNNKYNPGPQYRKLWATLDVKKANEMLDKIGLAKKDAEGYRLRTDGKGRLRIEIMTLGGQFVQYTQIAEMIREQWKKIGIDLDVQEVERSLALKRTAANEQQLGAWNNDGSEHLFTFPLHVFPFELAAVASSGPLYAKWFHSAGAQGKEPEPRMKELMEKWKKAFGVPEKERIQLGKEVWKIAAEEVYIIGVIGMGPASMGVRVVKTNMGNIPSRQYNSPDGKTPGDLPAGDVLLEEVDGRRRPGHRRAAAVTRAPSPCSRTSAAAPCSRSSRSGRSPSSPSSSSSCRPGDYVTSYIAQMAVDRAASSPRRRRRTSASSTAWASPSTCSTSSGWR